MLGSITEKKPSKVAALIVSNNGGFPPILRSAPKSIVRNSDAETAARVAENKKFVVSSAGASKQQVPARASSDSDMPTDEASSMNACTVDAMSAEEIALALEEIRSLLSPKSIEFLQKGPVPTEVAQPSRAVHRAKQQPVAHASAIEEKKTQTETSAEDSPWHGEQAVSGDLSRIVVPAESPLTERFDLNGRKVVDSEVIASKVVEEVVKSGLFNSRKGLAEEVGTALAKLCLECLHPVAKSALGGGGGGAGFYVWRSAALEASQTQPQDELKHHQYQNESPGYTLREILEVRVFLVFLSVLN